MMSLLYMPLLPPPLQLMSLLLLLLAKRMMIPLPAYLVLQMPFCWMMIMLLWLSLPLLQDMMEQSPLMLLLLV
jgi:hypothetical protein